MIDPKKFLKSFRYAFKGLRLVIIYENNARVHLTATLAVFILGVLLEISRYEWLWILSAIAFVWITETINTAIEKIVDMISPDYNSKAGAIKDISAAAVLMAAFYSVIVAAFIFIPKI